MIRSDPLVAPPKSRPAAHDWKLAGEADGDHACRCSFFWTLWWEQFDETALFLRHFPRHRSVFEWLSGWFFNSKESSTIRLVSRARCQLNEDLGSMTAKRLLATVCHLSDTRLQHCLSPFLSVHFVSFPFQRLCFHAPRCPGFCVVFKIALLIRLCRTNESARPFVFGALLINARNLWQNLASKQETTAERKLIFHETGLEKAPERNSVRNGI